MRNLPSGLILLLIVMIAPTAGAQTVSFSVNNIRPLHNLVLSRLDASELRCTGTGNAADHDSEELLDVAYAAIPLTHRAEVNRSSKSIELSDLSGILDIRLHSADEIRIDSLTLVRRDNLRSTVLVEITCTQP